jgi:hypothetical protein
MILKEFKVSEILCVITFDITCTSNFDTKCVHHILKHWKHKFPNLVIKTIGMRLNMVKWTLMVKKDKVVIKWDNQLSLNLIYNTINLYLYLYKLFFTNQLDQLSFHY